MDQEARDAQHRSIATRARSIAIAVLAVALVALDIALGCANGVIAGITYTGGT
jgi:hypothetical protein